jgi:TRAP-type C4-dicarboxylate transport system permease small subunit
VDELCNKIQRILAILAGALFAGVFAVTVLNIVLRNLAGLAWLWIPGASRLLFIWTVFMGAAVLYHRNDHLMMDFFIAKLQGQRKRRLEIVINCVFLVFLVLVIIYGAEIVRVRMHISFETWKFPTGVAYLAAPVSSFFMIIFCLNKLRNLLKGGSH